MSLLFALLFTTFVQAAAASDRATLAGQVLEDGTGTPVAGAQVLVMPAPSGPPPRGTMAAFRPLTATSDGEGRFEVTGVAPGRYRINAQKAGFAMPLQRALTFELGAGERRSVEVVLQRGAVIVGRVLDEKGEPLAEARVMAMQKMPMSPQGSNSVAAVLRPGGPSGQTNDLGEFRLFSLLPGEYVVQAMPRPDLSGGAASSSGPRSRTLLPTFYPSTSDQTRAESVTLSAGQTSDAIVITMVGAAAFQVSGTVVDESGTPIVNALVRLGQESASNGPMYMPAMSQARTDQSGRFSIGNVTSGAYVLLAIAPEVLSTTGTADAGASASGMSWSSISGGVSGSISAGVTTETSNGLTVRYRNDRGTRVPIVIDQSGVSNLQVTVKLR